MIDAANNSRIGNTPQATESEWFYRVENVTNTTCNAESCTSSAIRPYITKTIDSSLCIRFCTCTNERERKGEKRINEIAHLFRSSKWINPHHTFRLVRSRESRQKLSKSRPISKPEAQYLSIEQSTRPSVTAH